MLIPYEQIAKKILLIRNKKVMLDKDLASLYQVETKVLIQAVKRNKERFPKDFMFQLNKNEFDSLRSHFVTSKKWGGRRYRPYVFTEQGVAMLSSVLNSQRAIMVNIVIMRTFVKLRKILASHKDLLKKIEDIEKKYDSQFKIVFEAIRQLVLEERKPKRNIGFK
ncbi:MAG: ORF6N domain-containing protein [Candidatus Omnitrophica bacterium]|nr:ORF6N domain-containing protein [Candidatus Omnitrophota bacterium]